jgi:hypothetical protein
MRRPLVGFDDVGPGKDAFFDIVVGAAPGLVFGTYFLDKGRDLGLTRGTSTQAERERMLSGNRHERRAKQGVGPGGKDLDLGHVGERLGQGKADAGPLGATDPVFLHVQDFVGPLALELPTIVEDLLGVLGNPQEPLGQLALMNHRLTAPAQAVFDLLIGEHRGTGRTPVDERAFAIGEALFEHLDEDALLVDEVLGLAGRQLVGPVVGLSDAVERSLHRLDVLDGPVARMNLGFDGGVFGRQTERIPAHRIQDAVSLHAVGAGQHIANRVIANVTHVEPSRGIRKHLHDEILGPGIGLTIGGDGGRCPERSGRLPRGLPARLDLLRVVLFR